MRGEGKRELDKDASDLVARLCTFAGMIMEDVSPIALGSSEPGSEAAAIGQVRQAGLDIEALAHAAEVVARRNA